jgi:hypothetical protein
MGPAGSKKATMPRRKTLTGQLRPVGLTPRSADTRPRTLAGEISNEVIPIVAGQSKIAMIQACRPVGARSAAIQVRFANPGKVASEARA